MFDEDELTDEQVARLALLEIRANIHAFHAFRLAARFIGLMFRYTDAQGFVHSVRVSGKTVYDQTSGGWKYVPNTAEEIGYCRSGEVGFRSCIPPARLEARLTRDFWKIGESRL